LKYEADKYVYGDGAPEKSTVGDFWAWAFGDLCDDDIKGIYAEWIVTKILSIPSQRRVSWANSDIITPEGVRIEIKASAFWQSWKLINEDGSNKTLEEIKEKAKGISSIRFSGLKAGDSVYNSKVTDKDYKSDIYIFCFQKEEDPFVWNALDMNQWEFYIFEINELREFGGRTVSLKKLREIQAPLNASNLADKAKLLIERSKIHNK